MFEVYTGTGESKQPIKSFEKRNDAIKLAWDQRDRTSNHYGVRKDGKVVFNTNFSDPEFVATLTQISN